jgi:hypothetical protein
MKGREAAQFLSRSSLELGGDTGPAFGAGSPRNVTLHVLSRSEVDISHVPVIALGASPARGGVCENAALAAPRVINSKTPAARA